MSESVPKHYIKVIGKTFNFGATYVEDPLDVIQAWRRDGGIALSSSFILWHTITHIEFTRNWKPDYHAPQC